MDSERVQGKSKHTVEVSCDLTFIYFRKHGYVVPQGFKFSYYLMAEPSVLDVLAEE